MIPDYILGLYGVTVAIYGASIYAAFAHKDNLDDHLARLEIYVEQGEENAAAAETARYAIDPRESLNIVLCSYGHYLTAILATVSTLLLVSEAWLL